MLKTLILTSGNIATWGVEMSESIRARFKNLADKVMLPNRKIENVDLTGDGKIDGFQFDIVNPFYTAEPVSSVKDLLLGIDGEEVSSERIGLIVRDQRFRIRDIPTIYETWWGFGEAIKVFVEEPGGLGTGRHELDCTLRMRASAGNYGFGDMELPTKVTMEVKQA